VQLLISELNNATVNFFFNAKAMSFYFDLHVAEVVKECDTSFFDIMHQRATNSATKKNYFFTLHCLTLWEPKLFCIDRANSYFINTVLLVFIQRN